MNDVTDLNVEDTEIYYSAQDTSNDDFNKRLSNILGTLESKISEKEKQKVSDLLKKVSQFETTRYEKGITTPTKDERIAIRFLNNYLNNLTLKYIDGAKEYAEYLKSAYSTTKLSKNNPIIENIKSDIKSNDYKKIKNLYGKYVKDQNQIAEIADEIYSILLKYKKLDADAVLTNIFTVEYGLKGQFSINPSNLSIKYINPKGTGLKLLTAKEIKQYKNVWAQVKQILPSSILGAFLEFDISSDGEYGIAAYVEQLDAEGKYWRISIDPEDMKDKNEFYHTVIHEYAHYVSLNNTQVNYYSNDYSLKPSNEVYNDSYMVVKKESYINDFYNRFWKDIIVDRNADTSNQLFYCRHYTDFISSYASTSCTEDFAECFSYYVLPPNDLTDEMKEKLAFFDKYPELVQLKNQILQNMKDNNLL